MYPSDLKWRMAKIEMRGANSHSHATASTWLRGTSSKKKIFHRADYHTRHLTNNFKRIRGGHII